ncbi:hypothetical protein D3C87_1915110 [compost metagenome]
MIGIATEDVGRERKRLGHGGAGAAPMHDVLALGAVVAADGDGELGQFQLRIRLVADIVDRPRILGRATDIARLEREFGNLDFGDLGHGRSLQNPATCGSQRLSAGT